MIARRFASDEVGNHFHPRMPNKDPERFLLISGTVKFWFEDVHGLNRTMDLDADISGPVEVIIPPYLIHGIIVQSPVAWFLEQQAESFDPAANYSREEFNLLKESLKK